MMNCNLPKITYPALRTLLRFKLYEVIYPQTDVTARKVSMATSQNNLDFSRVELLRDSISLKRRSGSAFPIIYQSAIALQLSSVLRRDSLEVSYQILEQFQQETVNFCQEDLSADQYILGDFRGQVLSSGLIQFELGDRGLSVWLQCLMTLPLQSHSIPLSSPLKPLAQTLENRQQMFVCQHSYARCCSVLRLAQPSEIASRWGIQALDDRERILIPDPMPWLTPQGPLCLTHSAERSLISQLVTIGDDLAQMMTMPQLCLRSAFSLSQAFQTLCRTCQISELVSSPLLQRSQARLGLILMTQRLLKHLLEVGLAAEAPSEL